MLSAGLPARQESTRPHRARCTQATLLDGAPGADGGVPGPWGFTGDPSKPRQKTLKDGHEDSGEPQLRGKVFLNEPNDSRGYQRMIDQPGFVQPAVLLSRVGQGGNEQKMKNVGCAHPRHEDLGALLSLLSFVLPRTQYAGYAIDHLCGSTAKPPGLADAVSQGLRGGLRRPARDMSGVFSGGRHRNRRRC